MCGIVGVIAQGRVNQTIYDALTVLQHRGQDAAGIATSDGRRVHLRKDNGLVRDVFHTRHMVTLEGNVGIGHVRYPTAGSDSRAEAQPFYVNWPLGILLGHNGNLTNADVLREELYTNDLRHLNTGSDSEVLLNIFADELGKTATLDLQPDNVFDALKGVYRRCEGAYAVISMIVGVGILAFRDPHGIRPVVYGKRETPQGDEYMVASESAALDICGFELVRDLMPGEALLIDVNGVAHTRQVVEPVTHAPCIFEYVYFARPDSTLDNIQVHKTRLRMGDKLAEKIKRVWPDHDIDVVIPIPDSGRTAAMQLANNLNVCHREGFIKNRYIGRTFIMPGQSERSKSVRQKLNPIDLEFRGKNVLLVDDSIVRGTTSRKIIELAREAGAAKVYFASAAPAIRYPNVYGIDMPTVEELVAHGRTVEQVAEEIGADKLIYQDLDDLIAAAREGNPALKEFDTSCFDGHYITGTVNADYLRDIGQARNDQAKRQHSEEHQELALDHA